MSCNKTGPLIPCRKHDVFGFFDHAYTGCASFARIYAGRVQNTWSWNYPRRDAHLSVQHTNAKQTLSGDSSVCHGVVRFAAFLACFAIAYGFSEARGAEGLAFMLGAKVRKRPEFPSKPCVHPGWTDVPSAAAGIFYPSGMSAPYFLIV